MPGRPSGGILTNDEKTPDGAMWQVGSCNQIGQQIHIFRMIQNMLDAGAL